MTDQTETPAPVRRTAAKGRRDGRLRSAWRSVRQPLVQSSLVKRLLASLITHALWLIRWTNPLVKGESRRLDRRGTMRSTRPPSLRCGTASIC